MYTKTKALISFAVTDQMVLGYHVGKTRSYEECKRECFNYIIYTTPKSSFFI